METLQVVKLADAIFHLTHHGACWYLPFSAADRLNLCLDGKNEPKIGVRDDLYTIDRTVESAVYWVPDTLEAFLAYSGGFPDFQLQELPHTRLQSVAWDAQLLGPLTDAGYLEDVEAYIGRRDFISSFIPLGQETARSLREITEANSCHPPTWGSILLSLALGTWTREGSIMHATYLVSSWWGCGEIRVSCVEVDSDTVYHTYTVIRTPLSETRRVHQWLGIELENGARPEDDRATIEYHLQYFAGISTASTSIESTGWTREPLWRW